MATRRPLFFSTDWDPEEMAHADDIHIGKIVLDGVAGVALDGSEMLASNFGSPVSPGDLVTKEYADAIASGLDVHGSVIVKTNRGLGTQAVLAGSGGVFAAMAAETMEVKLHSAASWTTVTFTTEATLAAALATILAALGTGTAAINVDQIDLKDTYYGAHSRVQTQNVAAGITTKLGIPNGNQVGTGFTAVGSGVGKTLEAPTDSVSWNTIDGHLFAATGAAQRVLVSMESGIDTTADVDDGVYYVSTLGDGAGAKFKLTRATDLDATGELNQGVYVYVTDGTANGNTGWTCVTPDPITVDTTPNMWSQFSGAAAMTYDQGLKKVISSIQVDLDTNADAQTTGAAGGSSGLEFDVDTALGQLRVRVSANGGIERAADGIALNLEDTTLQLDGAGAGVSVKGLPAQFEIATDPVSANVSANNLDELTGGGSTALHSHSAVPATEAPKVEHDWVAGPAGVTAFYPVYASAVNDEVLNADTDTDTKSDVIGVVLTTEPSDDPVAVVSHGLQLGALTGLGFAAGDRIYLKTGGGLHNAVPGAAKKVVEIGRAKNAVDLFVNIAPKGRRAA